MALSKADLVAIAALMDERIAAVAPAGKARKARTEKPETFRSTKDGAEGFACSAEDPCGRTNIRTKGRAALHATTNEELQLFGHMAKVA